MEGPPRIRSNALNNANPFPHQHRGISRTSCLINRLLLALHNAFIWFLNVVLLRIPICCPRGSGKMQSPLRCVARNDSGGHPYSS